MLAFFGTLDRAARGVSMEAQPAQPAGEIERLRRCIDDLDGVTALPAVPGGGEPAEIVLTLLDVLIGTLALDLVYVRSEVTVGEPAVEMARVVQTPSLPAGPKELGKLFDRWLGDDPREWPPLARHTVGGGDVTVVPLRLGLHGEAGVLVAGSRRADFPRQTERLVLSVAANKVAVCLQQARLLGERRRAEAELDERVAQRTREAVERLQDKQELLDLAQKAARAMAFDWYIQREVNVWSPEQEALYGLRPGSFDGTYQGWKKLIYGPDWPVLLKAIKHAQETGAVAVEFRVQWPDGGLHWLATNGQMFFDERGRPFRMVGFTSDVTPRKLAEEDLRKLRSELAHVSRVAALGALTASIAHEVNQPLSGIITNASTCLRMLDAEPPNVEGARETARRTIRDGNRASDVIKRLRALFGKGDAAADPVDLNEATREVTALSLSELQRGRVILRTEFADDLPPVNGDRVQLQQVILNLLLNASDAMNGVEDRPRELVISTVRDEGGGVRLSVRDAGVGFDSQDVGRLFEAFYTTKSGGMGIGLSVSRSIIESHQGRLWAAPNDGPGATFSFTIPLASGGATDAEGALGKAQSP
jgi:PAS domain S-box-containing protein